MTMAERTEKFQRNFLEFLSERMKNEELMETEHPASHDNAGRTEKFQLISLEFLLERMKNEELRETDPPPSHDNGRENREILENFSRISLGENEE